MNKFYEYLTPDNKHKLIKLPLIKVEDEHGSNHIKDKFIPKINENSKEIVNYLKKSNRDEPLKHIKSRWQEKKQK